MRKLSSEEMLVRYQKRLARSRERNRQDYERNIHERRAQARERMRAYRDRKAAARVAFFDAGHIRGRGRVKGCDLVRGCVDGCSVRFAMPVVGNPGARRSEPPPGESISPDDTGSE